MDNLSITERAAPANPSSAYDNSYYEAEKASLQATVKSGANWFYWIAGLSLVNTVAALSGANFAFGLGLGLTQVFDAFASQITGVVKALPLIIDFVAIGVFAVFGYFGGKGQLWAVVTGTLLYVLDGLLLLLLMALGGGVIIIGLLIHGVALYSLFRAWGACRRLSKLAAEQSVFVPPPPSF